MRKDTAYNQSLLRQYRLLPQLLSVPVDSEEAMEALGAILSRDELEEQEGRTLQKSLHAPDRAFAKSLAQLGEDWWDCILDWSAECDFASSGWWVSVLYSARQIGIAVGRREGRGKRPVISKDMEASSMAIATTSFVGCGLYTMGEAARLLHVPPGKLKRWSDGYQYTVPVYKPVRRPPCPDQHALGMPDVEVQDIPGKRREPVERFSPRVVQADLPPLDGQRVISFREMIELRFVSWCRERKVPMHVIRAAATVAVDLFEATHPFALDRFATDGEHIFALVREKRSDFSLGELLLAQELPKCQFVFTHFVEPYFKDLDFEDHWASRWWPLGREKRVALDPARRFGEPLDNETGVPTHSLYQTYLAEGEDFERVAWWYDVPVAAVQYAVEYELSLTA